MASAELKRSLQTTSEVEITVTGRRSGREISNPVWFVQEDERLFLLPVNGSDTDWYRNVRQNQTIP
jgi:F420H(2)-dependent quinone reductase